MPNQYDNRIRRGVRSTTSMSPKNIMEDMSESIRVLSPDSSPLQWMTAEFGRGSAPTNPKIQVVEYHEFDNFDYCAAVVLGAAADGEERLARLSLTQPSRPTTNGSMYYRAQDKFYVYATGQTVEVVMSPNDAILVDGVNEMTATVALTGNTTTRSAADSVVVRNTEPYPIKAFTTSDVVFLGRTIYESQDIEATPAQRDLLYDCNFVEHKEAVVEMTEDQKNLIVSKVGVPDWDFQQEEMLKEFKRAVEFNMLFSERSVDFSGPRPKRHMRGLLNAIQTNVSLYNPAGLTGTAMENLFSNFLLEQGFRYNPKGSRKIGIAGPRFLHNFNLAFKDYRRVTGLSTKGEKAGLDIASYHIVGNYSLTLVRSDVLRLGTGFENWCFVIDPTQAEMRVKKDYLTKPYSLPTERMFKLMVEWQGTIAWHLEQSHALLRTV